MLPDYPKLSAWFEGPLGAALLEQESAAVGAAIECVFGQQFLQIGAWGPPQLFLDQARTPRRALLSARGDAGAGIRSHAAALPVQSGSIDAVILPHTLEFEDDPHEVLREAERVLTGEGALVILGFEPLGPWALRHRIARGGWPPSMVRVLSERRLCDWLKLLGFDVDPARRFLYTLPFARMQSGRPRRWLEASGSHVWPRLSGAYVLVARKRVFSMTPMRLRARPRPQVLAGGLVEPSARVGT